MVSSFSTILGGGGRELRKRALGKMCLVVIDLNGCAPHPTAAAHFGWVLLAIVVWKKTLSFGVHISGKILLFNPNVLIIYPGNKSDAFAECGCPDILITPETIISPTSFIFTVLIESCLSHISVAASSILWSYWEDHPGNSFSPTCSSSQMANDPRDKGPGHPITFFPVCLAPTHVSLTSFLAPAVQKAPSFVMINRALDHMITQTYRPIWSMVSCLFETWCPLWKWY